MSDQGRLVAGRYRLAESIGRGGMGTVWRAEDELLGRQVAVKKLRVPPELQDDERERLYERTRREARSAARIAHPNVVVVHDVVEDEGLPCVVMEYVRSRTLSDVLKAGGPITPKEAARIGRGMVAALRAAHRAGVLHRDVKPANVLLGLDTPHDEEAWPGGRVVLTDFGIASASGTSTLTRTGELIGSFDYLAPERITGGTPGPASDLWALGATLYQALEGVAPFHRDTPIETAYAIASEPIVAPRNAGPLGPLIESLLTKAPEGRMTAEQAERLLVSSVETVLTRDPAHRPPDPGAPAAGYGTALESDGTGTGTGGTGTGPEPVVEGPTSTFARLSTGPATDGRYDDHAAVPHPRHEPPSTAGTADVTRTTDAAPAVEAPDASTPQPLPPRGRRGRRHSRLPVVLVGIVAVVVAGAGGVLLGQRGSLPWQHVAGPSPSPTPTRPTASPSGGASTPPTPPGYRTVDESAYTVAIPDGWTRKRNPATPDDTDYIAPDGLTGLKVSVEDFAGPPLQHWQQLEAQLKPKQPGYDQLRMNPTTVTIGGVREPAAYWEWTWEGSVRRYHAIDLGFGKEGGTEYAVYLSAPDARWDQEKAFFDTAVSTFRPVPPAVSSAPSGR